MPASKSVLARMLELADELYDEDQCSLGLRHWTRGELEEYQRRAAELAELVLEYYTRPASTESQKS